MKFEEAIEQYIADQLAQGSFTSHNTVVAYSHTIRKHAEDAASLGEFNVADTGRKAILLTLARWDVPSTKRNRRAQLISFYDWTIECEMRTVNPARLVKGPKRAMKAPFIPDHDEILKLLDYSRGHGGQEWWAVEILVGAGLRSRELRYLRVRDLQRDGHIYVSPEAAKGGRERWVHATDGVRAVVRDVRASVMRGERSVDDFVIARRQTRDVGVDTPRMHYDPSNWTSTEALLRLLRTHCKAAGLNRPFTAQELRHYVGNKITKFGSIYAAQAWLGHADIGTTVASYAGIADEVETKKVLAAFSASLEFGDGPHLALAA